MTNTEGRFDWTFCPTTRQNGRSYGDFVQCASIIRTYLALPCSQASPEVIMRMYTCRCTCNHDMRVHKIGISYCIFSSLFLEYAALVKRYLAVLNSLVSVDMDFTQLEVFLTSQMKKRQVCTDSACGPSDMYSQKYI